MNKNIAIVLVGGFVIAILVAVMVQAGLSDKQPVVAESKAQILVASRDLRVGSKITSADVVWQEWPETMVFTGAVRRSGEQAPEEAVSGRLKERVAAGQPIHQGMLVDAERSNMLAASLRDGYRAIGVQVSTETIAGGLIGIGDYVDVVMTHTLGRTGNSTIARRYATETILENVRILGIDARSITSPPADESGRRKTRQTVTLEVDPIGAEKIALASEMGNLTLALRPLGDESAIKTEKATTDVGLSKILGRMTGGAGGGVRIYNGGQLQYAVSGALPADEQSEYVEGADMAPVPEVNEEDFVAPDVMMDAVREGIADGISRGMIESIE